MSTFLSYSRLGALVGGFRPLSVRRRQGAWTRVTDDQANTPAWLDDTRLIWQQDAYRNDGRQAFLETSDGRTYARKASVLAAGAGRWVAQYEQAAPGKSAKAVVLYDGLERTIYGDARTDHPSGFWGAGQHSVGHDGTLAYTPRFHEGRGVIVEAIDGSVLTRDDRIPVTTTSAIAWDAVVVWSAAEASHVWYWDGATWTRHRLAWPAYGGTAFRGRDGVYLAYSSGAQERAIVHRVDDASRGWLLGRKDHCYNACGWTDHVTGETWIAWSENAGATTDSVREERLVGEPKPWPVAPPTPITVPTLEKTSLKIGLLVFDHPARQIIEVGEAPSTATGAVLYTLSRGWLSQSRALAKTLDLYCLIYGDAHGLTPDRVPDDGDCLGLIYAYPSSYLTATQTLKLVEADCKAFARAKRQMAINLALYRRVRVSAAGEVSYDVDEQKMLDVFAGAWDIANKYGITLRTLYTQRRGNADTGLIDGIEKWPSAQELLKRAKAAVKSATDVPRPKTPAPPAPTGHIWFPKVRRFVSEPIVIDGVMRQVSWNPNADGKGHRPIYGFVRPNPAEPGGIDDGSVVIGTPAQYGDNPQDDVPDAASRVRLRPHDDDPERRLDIQFEQGGRQLTEMPGGELRTRLPEFVQLQELWYDGTIGGAKWLFHASGTALLAAGVPQ